MREIGYFVMSLFTGLAWVLNLALLIGSMIFGGVEIVLPLQLFIIPTLLWLTREL